MGIRIWYNCRFIESMSSFFFIFCKFLSIGCFFSCFSCWIGCDWVVFSGFSYCSICIIIGVFRVLFVNFGFGVINFGRFVGYGC